MYEFVEWESIVVVQDFEFPMILEVPQIKKKKCFLKIIRLTYVYVRMSPCHAITDQTNQPILLKIC